MTKERARVKAEQYLDWAERAEKKAQDIEALLNSTSEMKDWNFWTQPIHNNAGGRSLQRRKEQLRSKMVKVVELQEKAKRHREKAENLQRFANTNKGDAERKRQTLRDELDSVLKIGDRVHDACFGGGELKKIFKKSYRIAFDRGCEITRDKSYVTPE